MSIRLSARDASFLYLEESITHLHVASIMVFEGSEAVSLESLQRHVLQRIAYVPRYRQRVVSVPIDLAAPVWVDHAGFDVASHVHERSVAAPSDQRALGQLVATVLASPLPRDRPLWELTLIRGLSDGRFAVVTKVHPAMVDGVGAVDLAQVILSEEPEKPTEVVDTWQPAVSPSGLELITSAVVERLRAPSDVVGLLQSGLQDLRTTASRTAEALLGMRHMAGTMARSARRSPLAVESSGHRVVTTVATDLADYRAVRKAVPEVSIHDVVLATVAGALRSWLFSSGSDVHNQDRLRALVPVSVSQLSEPDVDSPVTSMMVELPIGEINPVVRLHQVAYQTASHASSGHAVSAESLAGLAGFAPPTLHALGARVAAELSRWAYDLVVTNVPGPQVSRYLGEHRMLETYPVIPLARGHGLSIGLTSYAGRVYYGINAEAELAGEVGMMAQCITQALAELKEVTGLERA